jgi:F0F1-type ATP synthase membrane subunit c/vacuolar-type H+-ATPase subunit K
MLAETFLILTIIFITVMGPSVVIAVLGYAVIKALGRNPSAASKIFMGMAIMLVFVESISIVAILIIFQLFSNKAH